MVNKLTYEELENKVQQLENQIKLSVNQESDKKYRTLFEKSKDPILIIENKIFVDCNQAAVDIMGYKSKKDFLNTSPSKLSPVKQPDGQDSFLKANKMISLALEQGSHRFEWNHTRANGEVFPVEVLLTTISKQKGSRIIHTIWRDITHRKKTEKKLQKSQNQFLAHLQNTPVGAISLDLNFKIVEWNPAAEKIFGFSNEEAINCHISDLIIPHDIKTEVEEVFKELLSDQDVRLNINENITRTGKRITCEWYNSVLYNLDGIVTGFASLVNDITEKKIREHQLSRFAKVIEQADEEVIITDPHGIIQYVNPSFEKNTGYTKQDVKGRTPAILNSGLHDPAFYKQIWTSILSKKIWRGKIKNRCKSGKILLHDMVISPIVDSKGHISSFVSIRRDITAQEKMERQLEQSRKMEAIGTLAGGIAHDFNNILSGIFGYAQLAHMNLDNPQKVEKSVSQITKGAKRAAELVQQILTFSRQTDHKKNPLRLYLIVKEAIKFLRSTLPATIEIKEDISSRAMVNADPTKIHQIIINLCTNAYHSMRTTGGIITIVLEEIDLFDEKCAPALDNLSGRYLKLEVSDTGIGMDYELQSKIFDPYFTTKKVNQGTGLGLSVVLGIIKEYNGCIKVSSEPGRGSTFQVYFPILKQRINTPPKKNGTESLKGGTERIMVIDDEESILLSTKGLLEDYGYKVTGFSTGASALEAFKKDPSQFDLIVTDMTMPKMTGDEFSYQALKIKSNIPIILCTGYSENISEIKALKIGIKKYLLKPIEKQTLLVSIRERLEKAVERS